MCMCVCASGVCLQCVCVSSVLCVSSWVCLLCACVHLHVCVCVLECVFAQHNQYLGPWKHQAWDKGLLEAPNLFLRPLLPPLTSSHTLLHTLALTLPFPLPSATWIHTPISVSTGWAVLSNKHPHTAPRGTGCFAQALTYSLFLLLPLLLTLWTRDLCISQCRICCASVTSSPRLSIAQPLGLVPARSRSI